MINENVIVEAKYQMYCSFCAALKEQNLERSNRKDVTFIQRIQSPVPRFFKTIRRIGLLMTAVSGTLLASPVVLPAAVVTVASYLALAGSVATAVAQTATETDG